MIIKHNSRDAQRYVGLIVFSDADWLGRRTLITWKVTNEEIERTDFHFFLSLAKKHRHTF